MADSGRHAARSRGTIDELPSGALRVRVSAGVDPISKRRLYLTELIAAGPKARQTAERIRTRLLSQVDERRSPRTRATVGQLLDKWLKVLDVDPSTRRTYEGYIRKHIRPLLGSLSLTRVDVEILDSFYSELRRCRDHCGDRRSAYSNTHEGKTHVCRGLARGGLSPRGVGRSTAGPTPPQPLRVQQRGRPRDAGTPRVARRAAVPAHGRRHH